MQKQFSKEEQLIKFFNEKFENSKTNEVSINKHELPDLNLSEKEASRTIYLLQEEGLLKIKQKSVHDDFSVFGQLHLTLRVFIILIIKSQIKKEQRRLLFNEIRAWITLIIAIAALIHSIYTTDSKSVSSQSYELPSVSDNLVHIP